ncbi:MAG: hypothetical protein GY847_14550, partial [Proteobacteria bacterium]|nr:hypothetical protein [Pseudomonadota bacterium]
LQDAEKRLNDTMELQSVMNRLEDFAAQIDSRLDELSWEEQRQVIRVLVARVEMDEEGATVIYRVPGSTDPCAAPRPDNFDTGKSDPDKSIQLSGRRGFTGAVEYLSPLCVGSVV